MRGGDRFVHECSRINGICFSFVPFNGGFLNFLALATPHQPGLPVPKCRQSRQLPLGGSQEEVAGADTIPCTHLFRERRGAKSPYHLQFAYSCTCRDIHANHWKSQVTYAIIVHNGLKGEHRGVCQRLFTGTEGERLRKIKEIELETIVDSVETSELTSIGRCGGIAST